MTTLTKIIVSTLLSLLFFSCNFDINLGGVVGNGHVVKETRTIDGPFDAIQASEGLNVYLTQNDSESIIVEADENLQDLIITEVSNNVLKIHTKKNIGSAASKKITVNFKNVSRITSDSGSNVYSINTIIAEELKLETSSGSDMVLDVNASKVYCSASSGSDLELDVNSLVIECHSSSGSDIELTGKVTKLTAEASSGSDIKASDLLAESTEAIASSGSDISVNTSKELIASANSGGGISYYGNPEKVERNDSPSGSIKKK